MLNLNQFNALLIGAQADLVKLNANFLFKKFEHDCIKFLYSYNGFFIEVWYYEAEAEIALTAFNYDYQQIEKYIVDADLFNLMVV